MTKRREPLTYQRTLEIVAATIGWDNAAALCGVSARSVRNWSDHDCQQEIRMIDAERLDRAFIEAGGDHAPFHRLMELRLEIASRDPRAGALIDKAGTAAKEAGEAVAALLTASARPDDANARRAALHEVHEAIDALTDSAAMLGGGTDG